MNHSRIKRLIRSAIKQTKLDLRGLNVLTEAATGYYALTPIIAALAGANSVLAYARTTRFGAAENVGIEVAELADTLDAGSTIEILTDKSDLRIASADIVTNLGMLRPLNAPFLAQLKKTAVIPLMWETWEFRPSDLDLAECRRLGIPVLGTDEHQSSLDIFHYVGLLPVKLLLEAGIEIYRSKIAVLGSGEFAAMAVNALRKIGAITVQIDTTNTEWAKVMMKESVDLDALCIIEHHCSAQLIGPTGCISARDLAAAAPGLTIVHVCGGADRSSLADAGCKCAPSHFASPGSMSVATDYVGPKPLIDLHTAGLRVGEVMARCRLDGLDRTESERQTLQVEPLAQPFP